MEIMNKMMKNLLVDVETGQGSIDDTKLALFIKMLWPTFHEVEGCVLMNSSHQLKDFDMDTVVERYGYKGGFEAAVNHVHLNDYLSHLKIEVSESVQLAVSMLEIWGMKLKSQFPHYNFHLVLSYDDEDREVSLRFYRLRENEGTWCDINSIENYAEALLIMER
ncbi:MAG: hypothetical protein ACYCYO_18890 [Bacilli bacterium]